MNVIACLLGSVLVTASTVSSVADRDAVSGRLEPARAFTPSCGVQLYLACSPLDENGRSTIRTLTTKPGSVIVASTFMRDSDDTPSQRWTGFAAYHVFADRRVFTPGQSWTVQTEDVAGCVDTWRVAVQP